MTPRQGKVSFVHKLHFNMITRNCWAFVQGSCEPETLKVEDLEAAFSSHQAWF